MNWFGDLYEKMSHGLGGKRVKRQRRYVLNVATDMPQEYLLQVLKLHTPVISASQFNKLTPELQKLFVPSRKS